MKILFYSAVFQYWVMDALVTQHLANNNGGSNIFSGPCAPRLAEPVVVVTARGLCLQAIFDTSYTYTIGRLLGQAWPHLELAES